MKNFDFLGRYCRDVVTGYEGVCIEVTEWMMGCDMYKLQPLIEDKEKLWLKPAEEFYGKRLEVLPDKKEIQCERSYSEERLFGKIVRDKLTGMTGRVIGRTITPWQESQLCVTQLYDKESSELPKALWMDRGRVDLLYCDSEADLDDEEYEDDGYEEELDSDDVQGQRPGAASFAAVDPFIKR